MGRADQYAQNSTRPAAVRLTRRRDEIGAVARLLQKLAGDLQEKEGEVARLETMVREAERDRDTAKHRGLAECAEVQRRSDAAQAEAVRRETAAQERIATRERENFAAREAQLTTINLEHQRSLAALADAIRQLVDRGIQGDFACRIDCKFDDPTLRSLADELNRLMDGVSEGCTEPAVVLKAVSNLDLTRRAKVPGVGVFGALATDVNRTADVLQEILAEFETVSAEMAGRIASAKSAMSDAADRAALQHSESQKSRAISKTLGGAELETVTWARTAQDQVVIAQDAAREGGAAIADAGTAIDRVAKSSDEMSAIVEVIEGIAFQTSLLSLNASVEAARAGDAGAGFAMVASEVRNLAQSAAESSAEIRHLIDRSRLEVIAGVDRVWKVAQNLEAIDEAVTDVSTLIKEISERSSAQSEELRSLSMSLLHLDGECADTFKSIASGSDELDAAEIEILRFSKVAGMLGTRTEERPERLPGNRVA